MLVTLSEMTTRTPPITLIPESVKGSVPKRKRVEEPGSYNQPAPYDGPPESSGVPFTVTPTGMALAATAANVAATAARNLLQSCLFTIVDLSF
jgi:hypothetical protein